MFKIDFNVSFESLDESFIYRSSIVDSSDYYERTTTTSKQNLKFKT